MDPDAVDNQGDSSFEGNWGGMRFVRTALFGEMETTRNDDVVQRSDMEGESSSSAEAWSNTFSVVNEGGVEGAGYIDDKNEEGDEDKEENPTQEDDSNGEQFTSLNSMQVDEGKKEDSQEQGSTRRNTEMSGPIMRACVTKNREIKEKRYWKCPSCKTRCGSEHHLKLHIDAKHSSAPLECRFCGKLVGNQASLSKHQRSNGNCKRRQLELNAAPQL